jgi:hypothetical protein
MIERKQLRSPELSSTKVAKLPGSKRYRPDHEARPAEYQAIRTRRASGCRVDLTDKDLLIASLPELLIPDEYSFADIRAPLFICSAILLLRWAVLKILMYYVYTPVSVLRPPCTRTAHDNK